MQLEEACLPNRLLLAADRALEFGHLLDLLHLERVASAALHSMELLSSHLGRRQAPDQSSVQLDLRPLLSRRSFISAHSECYDMTCIE